MNKQTFEMLNRVTRYGVSLDDAYALHRISMTLHRWHELECGDDSGCIERNEETGRPHWRSAWNGKLSRYPIPDREKGALRRLDAVMARYPDLSAYVQTDPRGAALYLYRKDDPMLASARYGIESVYSSIGCAIYK